MTSRRTFLRVLGSALIGAAVAPSLSMPASNASASPFWSYQTGLGSARPLSMELLREALEKCSRGSGSSPQYLITTRAAMESYARMCGLVYNIEIAA